MNFYKLGMFAALEKFAIKSTASDLPPFMGMLDPTMQHNMNQETLDLYRKMSPQARQRLNPMEQMQVGNLSGDPRFANLSQRATRDMTTPSPAPVAPKPASPMGTPVLRTKLLGR